MSEIEEPPAKVLKIDNMGATEPLASEKNSLLETSGHEEVAEEWLSEGILTDDDYNVSQEEDDRTDSQLGSQDEEPEEEHLEASFESIHDNNQIQKEIIGATENQIVNENVPDSAENVPENAENYPVNAVIGAEIAENDVKMAIDNSNIVGDEQMVPEIAENGVETAENVPENIENVAESIENVAESADRINVEKPLNNAEKSQILENLLIFPKTSAPSESEINTTTVIDKVTIINALKTPNIKQESSTTVEQNIEETMKHLDGSKEDMNSDDFNELISKKPDTKDSETNVKTEVKKEDDGNDTDDLLRMLGGDDNKTKKLTKTVKDLRRMKAGDVSSDDGDDGDDDFVYEGVGAKKLKAAKNVISKKQPTKAVPEDFDDGDDESDHSVDDTMKRMFNKTNLLKNKPNKNPPNVRTPNTQRTPKNILNVVEKPAHLRDKSTPVKQYQNKNVKYNKSILKPSVNTPKPVGAKTSQTNKPNVKTELKKENKITFKPDIKTPAPFKSTYKDAKVKMESDDEQFLDDDISMCDDVDDNHLESDLEDENKTRQRIMKPEMMDEDMPSDAESHSDGSLYDEIPSSDSEDMDDWFTLDIRAEKAGDYIPLLGSKGKELLLEEKQRVANRLQTLKQSLSALTDSGKRQADQLRDATMTLAELDDMIKAS